MSPGSQSGYRQASDNRRFAQKLIRGRFQISPRRVHDTHGILYTDELGPVRLYIEVGAAENYRPDYSQFPASALGNVLQGYSNERYLDIRSSAVVGVIGGYQQGGSTDAVSYAVQFGPEIAALYRDAAAGS